MESTGCVAKRENTATAHKIAAVSAVCFALGSSAENVCAQNAANNDTVIQLTSSLGVSGYESFVTRPNPPAIITDRKNGNGGAGEAASNERIIVDHVTEREQPASIQPIASAPPAMRAAASVEKVTATREESPVAGHTTSVTLWDEIAPPVPAPVPVDAATRSTPGDVASAATQRAQ